MTLKLQTISARDSHFFADCIIKICIWNSLPDSFVTVRIASCFNIRLDKFYCGFTVSRLQSVFCSIFLYPNYFLGIYQCRMSALTASQTNVADFRCFVIPIKRSG